MRRKNFPEGGQLAGELLRTRAAPQIPDEPSSHAGGPAPPPGRHRRTGVESPAAPPKLPSREAQLKVAQSATDVPPP